MKHIIDIETWERRDNYNFSATSIIHGYPLPVKWIALKHFQLQKPPSALFSCITCMLCYVLPMKWKNSVSVQIKTDRWSITIRWTSYHLSLYPARLSTQSASLTMQILNGFMPKHITSSITSPKRVTRMEPKSHYRTGRFWYYPTECHASALFHFTHLYTNGSRPSIRLSADECRQSSATRRKTGNAHRFHCKPCFCGRSAHRTTLSENRGDIERAGSINRGVSKGIKIPVGHVCMHFPTYTFTYIHKRINNQKKKTICQNADAREYDENTQTVSFKTGHPHTPALSFDRLPV